MSSNPYYQPYAQKLMQLQRCFGAWPPVLSGVQLGSYGELAGDGFIPLGTLPGLVGLTLDPAPPSPSANFNIASDKTSTQGFQIVAGSPPIPVEDVGIVEGQAMLKYTCASNANFHVVASDVTRIDIAADVEDYLREQVWPLLAQLSKGGWNGDWRVVTSLRTATSYVLAGGAGSTTTFELTATGKVLSDLGSGSISAQINFGETSNVSYQESAYQVGTAVVIGFELYHFKSGAPVPDQS